jgi:hypothetical protein
MSNRKSLVLFLAAAVLFGGEGFAQSASEPATTAAQAPAAVPEGGVPRYVRPETPEQRMERLGTQEDPGPDPDPEKVFYRFGKAFKIFKVEKRHAKYLPEVGWVRPLANANFSREIYQENEKYIWVWDEIIDRDALLEEAAAKESPWSKEAIEYFEVLRSEFTPLDVAQSGARIRFADSSNGLPASGSWRNGAALADMNEDGFVDLVLPPQRGPAAAPAIFLGDGNGGWTRWSALKWPRNFNYGTVVAADFNKDKHLDLAFSIHLGGVAVFLGDGKGLFREVVDGLEGHYPTRRMITADVDADGWMDVVAVSEGPVGRGRDVQDKLHGNLRAYLNRQKGQKWEGINVADPREFIGGDYVSAGMFNGDRYPDFIGASVYFNSAFTLYLSKAKSSYDPLLEGFVVPGRSYFQATTTGKFLRGKTDDAIVSFLRYWPSNLEPRLLTPPPLTDVSGIDRISFVDGSAKRTSIIRWKGAKPVRGMASGDLDGDGNLDIAYVTAQSNELSILLGDGKGGFKSAEAVGIELPPLRTYDLVLADVNRDRRPDVVVMFEASQATAFSPKNGSVKVFLNKATEAQ